MSTQAEFLPTVQALVQCYQAFELDSAAHIRALGVALPYALANTIFGGTAEYVALSFKQAGWERGFYWYVTAMIGVSLVTYLLMRDTRVHSKILED